MSFLSLRLGDRVETKLGEGTVVAFEYPTPAGRMLVESSPRHNTTRVLVALDNPKRWFLADDNQPHPFMMPSDLYMDLGYVTPKRVSTFVPTPEPVAPPPEAPVHWTVALMKRIAHALRR